MRALLVLLSVVLVFVAATTDNEKLWNEYREALKKSFQEHYCAFKGQDCEQLRQSTILQMVDDPLDAAMVSTPYRLNEQLCKYVPINAPNFDLRCNTIDCSFPKLYEDATVMTGDAMSFVAFQRSKTVSFPELQKSYPWSVTRTQHKNGPLTVAEIQSVTNHVGNSWGGQTYQGTQDFMRKVLGEKYQPKSDEELSDAEAKFIGKIFKKIGNAFKSVGKGIANVAKKIGKGIVNVAKKIGSGVVGLFKKQRRPAIPIPIQINHFQMKMTVAGLSLHALEPGPWFDRNILMRFADKLSAFLNRQNGKMNIIPDTVIVAQRPVITVTISESVYNDLHASLRSGAIELIRVGGVQFYGTSTRVMGDNSFELTDGENTDTITFSEVESSLLVSQSDVENPRMFKMEMSSGSDQIVSVFSKYLM